MTWWEWAIAAYTVTSLACGAWIYHRLETQAFVEMIDRRLPEVRFLSPQARRVTFYLLLLLCSLVGGIGWPYEVPREMRDRRTRRRSQQHR